MTTNTPSNRAPKALVVGSFVMDLIVSAPRFPNEGETVLGDDFNMAPGGKGLNQAVQMARLGLDVTMVGAVGQDMFGETMLEAAREAGVDVSHVLRLEDVPSAIGNVQLEVSKDGQTKNRIIVVSGANMRTRPEDIAFLEETITDYDIVLLQQEIPSDVNLAVARMAKRHGVPIMLNPAPSRPIDPELLHSLTIISPNEHEARAVAGSSKTLDITGGPDQALTTEEIRSIAAWLRAEGIPNLLVTLGERGAILINEDSETESPSVRLEHVADPTAAGDSFIGAFSTAYVHKLDLEQALTFANHCAALTVSKMGALTSLPTRDELLAFLEAEQVDAALINTVKGW